MKYIIMMVALMCLAGCDIGPFRTAKIKCANASKIARLEAESSWGKATVLSCTNMGSESVVKIEADARVLYYKCEQFISVVLCNRM